MTRLICRAMAIALCLGGAASFAVDGGTSSGKSKPPAIGIPKFSDLPKADDLRQPKPTEISLEPSPAGQSAQYSVVRVVHAKEFHQTAGGATPKGGALSSIALTGQPPTTEAFITVVRVKSPQRANAPIQVQILDPRGEPALSSSGEVSFRGVKKNDEVDYIVEWSPTPCRAGGEYQVSIRILGKDMGTWPLKFTPESK